VSLTASSTVDSLSDITKRMMTTVIYTDNQAGKKFKQKQHPAAEIHLPPLKAFSFVIENRNISYP
jgi:hypothetical protein